MQTIDNIIHKYTMKKQIYEIIILLVLFVILFVFFHQNQIKKYPNSLHTWAQTDRYALALGFVNNNLNFFKPQTLIYNHQFPHNWQTPGVSTITAVDFPIHDYIPAVFMKITGCNSIFIFRIYILIYGFVGLFFLYKLALQQTKNRMKSFFVLIFAATSPVFIYYQQGLLPGIPSWANAVIGLYFYLKYHKNNTYKSYIAGITFLTLAALSRTTFAIPLVAAAIIEVLRRLKGHIRTFRFIPLLVSVSILVGYAFYNSYLRNNYGSDFLHYILPPQNLAHALDILKATYKNWFTHYFSFGHYILFFALLVIAAAQFIQSKTGNSLFFNWFLLLIAAIFAGCGIFSILMLQQFAAHDYYFIDTFFLPFLLLLIAVLRKLPSIQILKQPVVSCIFISIVSVPLFVLAYNTHQQRIKVSPDSRTASTIENFRDASSFLDSVGVPPNSRILVIDAIAPNLPFVFMQRKGYAVMNTKKQNIRQALKWDFDYLIVQNDYFVQDVYAAYPQILQKIKPIADNKNITLCRISNHNMEQTLSDFFNIESRTKVFEQCLDFENDSIDNWSNIFTSSVQKHSGEFAHYISAKNEFGITLKTQNMIFMENQNTILQVAAWVYAVNNVDCHLVVSIKDDSKDIYYQLKNINRQPSKTGEWQKVDMHYFLPPSNSKTHEFAIYVWNNNGVELYIDDFCFSVVK